MVIAAKLFERFFLTHRSVFESCPMDSYHQWAVLWCIHDRKVNYDWRLYLPITRAVYTG